MLTVKFFQVNGNYYAKARHDGNVVDTTAFYGNTDNAAEYIKNIMTWGYDRSEIEFLIDASITDAYDADNLYRLIGIYAD